MVFTTSTIFVTTSDVFVTTSDRCVTTSELPVHHFCQQKTFTKKDTKVAQRAQRSMEHGECFPYEFGIFSFQRSKSTFRLGGAMQKREF